MQGQRRHYSREVITWVITLSLITDVVLSDGLVKLKLKQSDDAISRVRRSADQRRNLAGKPGQGYYTEVQIGTPPQKLNVLIDTGSSNFAVAASDDENASKYFHRENSSTYQKIGTEVFVPYTQGQWKGVLGSDMVAMTSLSNVTVRSDIAFITESSGFFINGSHWQGILGMGYAEIAQPSSAVTPFFDSMVSDAGLENVFSMQLCGTLFKTKNKEEVEKGGSLVLGGVDSSLYTGSLLYTPINKEWYYEVVMVDVKVNDQSLKMDCKEYNFPKTIVDSGTTNLRLPVKVWDRVVDKIKSFVSNSGEMIGESFWLGIDHVCWDEGLVPYDTFPSITLTLPQYKNSSFDLVISPQQYLRPVGEENDDLPSEDCFKFAISSSTSGSVIGAVVLEGFYTVFDRARKRIGFADSTCPVRNSKAFKSTLRGPMKYTGNATDCGYYKTESEDKTLTIVAYVMAAICCVCLLPLILMIMQWQWQRCSCRRLKRQNSDSNDLIDDDR